MSSYVIYIFVAYFLSVLALRFIPYLRENWLDSTSDEQAGIMSIIVTASLFWPIYLVTIIIVSFMYLMHRITIRILK
jgi:hypothetical protein